MENNDKTPSLIEFLLNSFECKVNKPERVFIKPREIKLEEDKDFIEWYERTYRSNLNRISNVEGNGFILLKDSCYLP